MMLRFVLVACLCLGPWVLNAGPLKLRVLRVGAKTYRNVTVLGANTTDVYFRHEEGIANVRLKYLNEDLQRRFNYDAQAATEAERQQAEDDARYQSTMISNMVVRARQAALAAQRAAASSNLSLLDSISDKSPVGKPSSPLNLTRWAGEKPELEGKYVVRFFWAPWSVPCRNAIPGLNTLQEKFGDHLAVVGVTTESEADIAAVEGAKPRFPSALDQDAKFVAASGVTSVPEVTFLDPKGIVLYQGHPAALNTNNLSRFFKPPAEELSSP